MALVAAGGRASGVRREAALWLAQRASAAVLAACVALHLVTMIVAVRGGLSGAEILARTRASLGWATFYAVFVLAVAVHAPLGLRAVLAEWARLRGRAVDTALAAFALALALGGFAAIRAVVAAP